ncbi:MAG: aspartate/glutamate racemase family protein [Tissierellales bacterium]|nr:aspartate/glutamate racemase family protein [Tissierellales bacterium]
MKKKVGIIGGMGPEATLNFFKKVIEFTDAKSDQEHVSMVIDNNTKIQDRSLFILNGGPNPKEELIGTAKKLQNYGAEIIAMPCNTAHFFYEDIKSSIDIPIINMIEETANHILKEKKNKKIILLSTEGTYKSKIYEKVFEKKNLDLIIPSKNHRKQIMELIYKVKKNEKINYSKVNEILKQIKVSDEIFLLGCTELPIIFQNQKISEEYIDTVEILAKEVILKAGYKLKNGI